MEISRRIKPFSLARRSAPMAGLNAEDKVAHPGASIVTKIKKIKKNPREVFTGVFNSEPYLEIIPNCRLAGVGRVGRFALKVIHR